MGGSGGGPGQTPQMGGQPMAPQTGGQLPGQMGQLGTPQQMMSANYGQPQQQIDWKGQGLQGPMPALDPAAAMAMPAGGRPPQQMPGQGQQFDTSQFQNQQQMPVNWAAQGLQGPPTAGAMPQMGMGGGAPQPMPGGPQMGGAALAPVPMGGAIPQAPPQLPATGNLPPQAVGAPQHPAHAALQRMFGRRHPLQGQ